MQEKSSDDVEKSRYSHQECSTASISTTNQPKQATKEPNIILFFCGTKFEFTYNKEGKFSQSQMALLCDPPPQNEINRWRKIKVLAAPPLIKDV